MSLDEHTVPESLADSYVCVNGDLRSTDEPHLRAYDRGFLYGDGVYDAFPVYDSKGILVDRHIDRLFRSARAAKIDLPHSKERIREWVVETLETSGVENGGCRIVVSRGAGPQGLKNTGELGPTVVVIPSHVDRDDVDHRRPTTETARIVSTRTNRPDVVDPKLKGLNYLNNVLAERELLGTDATIGIMLDPEGRVAEAYDANLFLVDDRGMLHTPSTASSLAGVTREVVMECAEREGFDVEVREVTPAELFAARDLFVTGAGCGISAIVELDGRQIGDGSPGDEVLALTGAFLEYVTSNEYLSLDT